ncbi:glycoside hydrolase family 19 protein [Saccharibacter floricola]|nr:glycoside hydrolase family 19 protein [Saccharibacter floricola]
MHSHLNINETLSIFNINTKKRIAVFLSQVSEESGNLSQTKELAPKFKKKNGKFLIVNGNIYPEDGHKFRGRGPLQITGRENYRRAGIAIGDPSLTEHPEMVETPSIGMKIAAYLFSDAFRLNPIADQVNTNSIQSINDINYKISRAINGTNTLGLEERLNCYLHALDILGLLNSSTVQRYVEISPIDIIKSLPNYSLGERIYMDKKQPDTKENRNEIQEIKKHMSEIRKMRNSANQKFYSSAKRPEDVQIRSETLDHIDKIEKNYEKFYDENIIK